MGSALEVVGAVQNSYKQESLARLRGSDSRKITRELFTSQTFGMTHNAKWLAVGCAQFAHVVRA